MPRQTVKLEIPSHPARAALPADEAAAYVGQSARKFADTRKRPDFPKPRDLTGSGRCLVWLRAELDAWLVAQPPAIERPEPAQLARARAQRSANAGA